MRRLKHDKRLGLFFIALCLPMGASMAQITHCADASHCHQDNISIAADTNIEKPSLESGFDKPPHESKPGTLFHIMSSNVTREGIALDLDAIERVGIGKMLLFEVSQGIAHGPVKFGTPEHIEMIGYLAAEAKRRNINFGAHNSDGWTSSGGPWITLDESMKRIVWSEQQSDGGKLDIKLGRPRLKADYFRDIATIAFPSQKGDEALSFDPLFSGTGAVFDPQYLTDDDLESDSVVRPVDGKAVLTIDLQQVRQVGHLDMITRWWGGQRYTLELSADGQNWNMLPEPYGGRLGKQEFSVIASFTPVMARYLRLTGANQFGVRNVMLAAQPRVPDFYARTSYGDFRDRSSSQQLPVREKQWLDEGAALQSIDPKTIIDLTNKIDENGQLRAQLPAGKWTIMRFGYTTTGAVNVPASPEGTGYEVDKFSKAAVEKHYNAYMRKIIDSARSQEEGAFNRTLIDSYEVGGQNWTQGYRDIFAAETGQNIVPYLPLFAGRMVGDANESAAFYDSIRRLNARLMHEGYFDHFTDLARADGLQVYIEGYGFGPFNSLDASRKVDLPMPEFWLTPGGGDQTTAMISAANIYGRNEIAAEAFTSQPSLNWQFHPGMAKKTGDEMWTRGINAFVFHRFAHQANIHVKPGMTMNRWGAHFDRHQPWWDTAGKAWFEYIARGQFLLRQGIPVADVAYFVGDSAPSVCPATNVIRRFTPISYKFDCVNYDVLANRFTIENGRLMRPDGNGYAVLVLGNSHAITAQTLERLEEIAAGGVPIFGQKPVPIVMPGTNDKDRAAAQARIDAVWSKPNFHTMQSFSEVLARKQPPRFMAENDTPLEFMQRRTDEGDIFFTYNPSDTRREFKVSIYGTGKTPEIWDAATGKREKVSAYHYADGRTHFNLPLELNQSAFIIMPSVAPNDRKIANEAESNIKSEDLGKEKNIVIADKWSVTLDEAAGDTFKLQPMALVDLKDHTDQSARDFAGIAHYSNHFNLDAADLASADTVMLDLGEVAISAQIFVNGKPMGTSWVAPHRLNIRSALKAGANHIEIKVATLWINQLIADAALPDTSGFIPESESYGVTNQMIDWYAQNLPKPEGPRKTFATQNFYEADSPRVPSGLIGPVQIIIKGNFK